MTKKYKLLKSKKSYRNLRDRDTSKKNKLIASKFSKEYFDGTRSQGYGGYYYTPVFNNPKGLALSLDETLLYVADEVGRSPARCVVCCGSYNLRCSAKPPNQIDQHAHWSRRGRRG